MFGRLAFVFGALGVLAGLLYTMAPITAVPMVLPEPPSLRQNDLLKRAGAKIVGPAMLLGPESLVVSRSPEGGEALFAGLQDGRIVRITHTGEGGAPEWRTVIKRTGRFHSSGRCGDGGPADLTGTEPTCGRPLGLRAARRSLVLPSNPGASPDEEVLLVADAYYGLLCVLHPHGGEGPAPGMLTLATRARGDPEGANFTMPNDVVVAPDGTVYFTETSTEYQRRRIFYAALSGKPTGRLLAWRDGKGAKVVAKNLWMPNGLTLSTDGRHLLLVSGTAVLRYNLATGKMEPKPLVESLPGTGDNIRTMSHLPSEDPSVAGTPCYLTGLGSLYAQPFSLLHASKDLPWLRQLLTALLPYESILEAIPKYGMVAAVAEDGTVLETYQDPSGMLPWFSEAEFFDGFMYIGSWYSPFLVRVPLEQLRAQRRLAESP